MIGFGDKNVGLEVSMNGKIEFITNDVHPKVYAVQVFTKNNANIKTF
jgi:hypothetical protein